jgi:protein TonB
MSTLTAPTPDMGAMSLRVGRAQRDFKPKSKVGPIGIAVMVAFHLVMGYALYSGLGSKVVQLVKKPLDATIIEEVKLAPPPPPPPKQVVKQEAPKVDAPPPPAYVPPPQVSRADAPSPIAAVQTAEPVAPPPAAPPVVAAPVAAPLAASAPPAPPKVVSADMSVACPKQVKPVPPEKALEEGISGVVKVEVRIKGGKVVEVKMLSGPKVYYAAVRTAINQYECSSNADEIVARQEFDFKVE